MSGFIIPVSESTDPEPKDYLIQVADGKIPGHSYVSKFGERLLATAATAYVIRNPAITTSRLSTAQTCTIESSSVNDTSAGTGARRVLLTGITSDGTEVSETLILNGTTKVDTVNPYSIIHEVVVLAAGSGKVNAGNISVKDKATGTSVIAYIETGRSITTQCFYQVPAGKNLYIRQVLLETDTISGGNPVVIFRLWFYSDTLGAGESKVEGYKVTQSVTDTGNYATRNHFIVARATPGTYIEMEAVSDKNNTTCRCSFQFVLIDA